MGRKIDKIVAIHTEAIEKLDKASIVQLVNKINEIIDYLGDEGGEEIKEEKDWKVEVERIMREDRFKFSRVAHTVYYYREKLEEMLQLIEEEKEKSQRGVFTKEELQFLKCVLNDKETVRYYSNGGDGYLGEHIEPILEKIDKLSNKGDEE